MKSCGNLGGIRSSGHVETLGAFVPIVNLGSLRGSGSPGIIDSGCCNSLLRVARRSISVELETGDLEKLSMSAVALMAGDEE
jgi:hypothetical protein